MPLINTIINCLMCVWLLSASHVDAKPVAAAELGNTDDFRISAAHWKTAKAPSLFDGQSFSDDNLGLSYAAGSFIEGPSGKYECFIYIKEYSKKGRIQLVHTAGGAVWTCSNAEAISAARFQINGKDIVLVYALFSYDPPSGETFNWHSIASLPEYKDTALTISQCVERITRTRPIAKLAQLGSHMRRCAAAFNTPSKKAVD